MGLYNRSAMAATFDMQIGKFSNSNPPKRVHKKSKNQINIDDWRAFTSILNMQISPWWPSWLCKLVAVLEFSQDNLSEHVVKNIIG